MKTTTTYEELKARLDALSGVSQKKTSDLGTDEKKKAEIYNSAFWGNMHTGIPQNALKAGSDGSGGYLIPDTYDSRLVKALAKKNVLRKLGHTIQTTHKLHIPVSCGINNAFWKEEGKPFPFSDAKFNEIIIDAYKLATSILVSDEMLEDTGVDLERYIETVFAERIGDAEEEAFVRGDGKNKPLGIIYQAIIGKESESSKSISTDDLLDLMHSVKVPYRDNAVWLVSEDAYCKLSQIRHHNGNSIWSEGLEKYEPKKLFGHSVYICKNLDCVIPGGIPVMFGDFRYFWIGDRNKRVMKRLIERFADRGQVAFITSERVDAKLIIPEAVKMLKIKETE